MVAVEAGADPSLMGRFRVLSTPTWILLVDGEETARVAGLTHVDEIMRAIEPCLAASRHRTGEGHGARPRNVPASGGGSFNPGVEVR